MSVSLKSRGYKAGAKYISELEESLEGDLNQALVLLGDDIAQEARSNLQNNAHVYTSELLNSIGILETGENYIIVGSRLPYAVYIEYGRGPVRPINAKFLHYFTKDGKEIFSKFSKATEPSPFLEPAAILKASQFEDVTVELITSKHREPIIGNDQ